MKQTELNGKKCYAYTLAELKANLKLQIARNDSKAIHAMLVIYEFQTESEKLSDETIEDNGYGFNGVDSKLMSNITKFYKRNGYLSPKQMSCVKRIMPKYAGQLLNNSIANKKIIKLARGLYVINKD